MQARAACAERAATLPPPPRCPPPFLSQQEAKFEAKFRDAIRYYEPAVRIGSGMPVASILQSLRLPVRPLLQVKKHWDSILDVTAIVLANLCVSYIMTTQNEEAEEVMRRIEREEERCDTRKRRLLHGFWAA